MSFDNAHFNVGAIIRRVFNSGLLNHRLHCKNITSNISPHWQGSLMDLSNYQCYLPVLGKNPEIYFLTPRESRLLQVIFLWLLRPLESQTRRVHLIWYCHIMSPVLVEWLTCIPGVDGVFWFLWVHANDTFFSSCNTTYHEVPFSTKSRYISCHFSLWVFVWV